MLENEGNKTSVGLIIGSSLTKGQGEGEERERNELLGAKEVISRCLLYYLSGVVRVRSGGGVTSTEKDK
jgi:hypothetical protein